MATRRQIKANRRNARSSTGPKTEAGKAASSANALSHGLTAVNAVVLPEEDPDKFERLREGVVADLAPAGALQQALAHRIAMLLWRLHRVNRLEAELFVHGRLAVLRDKMGDPMATPAVMLSLLDPPKEVTQLQEKYASFRSDIDQDIIARVPSAQVLAERRQSARAFDQIARHEAMLQRALNRTLDEFRRLRAASGVSARGGTAQAGEKAFLQNEANSAQALELAPDSGAQAEPERAGAGGPPGCEGPAGALRTG